MRLQGSPGQNVALQFTDTTGAAAYIAVQGDALRLGTNNAERLRIKSNGSVGIGTNNPVTRLHVADTNTTVWPFASAVTGTYGYTPYPHELVIDNDVKGTTGSFAGIYFNAGADTDGSKVSTARIAAVDTGDYKADLVFATRGYASGGGGADDHKEHLRIASTGNMSLGTTNVTEGLLNVAGDITAGYHHGSDMYGMLAKRKFDGGDALGGYAIRYASGYE